MKNSAPESDHSEDISRSSSIPSLSSLCSSSSVSCLGNVPLQYEPLKVDTVNTDGDKNKLVQCSDDEIVSHCDDQVSIESSGKDSVEDKPYALTECTKEVECTESHPSSDSGRVVPMFPSEVTVNDTPKSSEHVKSSENLPQVFSKEKKIKSCLKRDLTIGKRKNCSQKRNRVEIEFMGSMKPMHKRARVKLRSQVCIIPIPSRNEYSHHIKSSLWSSSSELYANALRNSIEFAAEGWNWRNATEDDQMIVHVDSGERIHPVHIRNVFDAALSSDNDSDCCDSADVSHENEE